jgi:FkbH-like protein
MDPAPGQSAGPQRGAALKPTPESLPQAAPSPRALELPEVLDRLRLAGWKGFALLRRYRSELSGSARPLVRGLRSLAWERRDDYEGRRVRFAFTADASTANLEDALWLESLDRGIVPVSYHSALRQVTRELRDPASGLYAHEPDVAVVAASFPADPDAGSDAVSPDAFLDALAADLRAFRARSSAVLLVHGFVAPEFRPLGIHDWREPKGLFELYARLNLGLAERCRDIADTHVVDVGRHLARSGASWSTLHRSAFLAGVAASENLAPFLCRDYAAAGAARRGLVRKVLALDLDDTLWGGVVGEVGAAKVQVGNDHPGNIFRAIQRAAQKLHERGVVLAINSRNEEEDGWAPFRTRPEMALERRHFAAWRINWKDKATNMRELASELRLGLDSFVMLDNDPVQRAWVEDQIPEVHVIPAGDPLDMLRALADQRLFDGLSHTPEDALRAASYTAATRRREEDASAVDRAAFLAGLGLVVTVRRASPAELPRLAQLAERTNQFNLTTRRYSEAEIARACAEPDTVVLSCSSRDRFAADGIVGLAILKGGGPEWVVDTLLLSCRVLGWGVERALLAAACRVAAERGASSLRGEFIPSAKNGIAKGFYAEAGFSRLDSGEERQAWRLALPAPADVAPAWIELVLEEAAA